MSSDRNSVYRIKAITALLDIFEVYLKSDKVGLGVTEISQLSGYDKSRVYRILRTLLEQDYVEITEDRNYRLGFKLLELGEFVKRKLDLPREADPYLIELAQKCGDTVLLDVRDGTDAVCIAQHHGDHILQVGDGIRRRTPMYAGAGPFVLLAFAPEPERERILADLVLQRIASQTNTDKDDLLLTLGRIRERGHARNDEELDQGVCSAVAAPVRDHSAAVVAAISIVGPKYRFDPPRRRQLIEWVMEAGEQISRKLGYAGSQMGRPA